MKVILKMLNSVTSVKMITGFEGYQEALARARSRPESVALNTKPWQSK